MKIIKEEKAIKKKRFGGCSILLILFIILGFFFSEKTVAASAHENRRILIGGKATVTIEAARIFAKAEIKLIGNESQSVGPLDHPAEVHYELLGKDIVLLEGIRLEGVEEGVYFLNAAPLKLGGSDGAPCRAILIACTEQ